MQSVGLGPIAPAPAGSIGTRTGSTWVGHSVSAARRFVVRVVLAAAFLLAARGPRDRARPAGLGRGSRPATGRQHRRDRERPLRRRSRSCSATPPRASPTSREWDFGDGTQAHRQTPEHPYAEAGTYTVTLTVANEGGTSTASVKVRILARLDRRGPAVHGRGLLEAGDDAVLRRRVEPDDPQHRVRGAGPQHDDAEALQRLGSEPQRVPDAGAPPASIRQAGSRCCGATSIPAIASSPRAPTAVPSSRRPGRSGSPAGRSACSSCTASMRGSISGFTATADPAATNTFKVVTVSVEGPAVRRPPVDQRLRPHPEHPDVVFPVLPLPPPVPRPVRAQGLAQQVRRGHPVIAGGGR